MTRIKLFTGDKTNAFAHLFLRVLFGFFLMLNGWDKLIYFSAYTANFTDPLGFGPAASLSLVIFAELVCGLFIGIGFLTRLSTLPVSITFIVAVFVAHGNDPFAVKQAAILYLVLSLYFIITVRGIIL